jgi:hypothetical protein
MNTTQAFGPNHAAVESFLASLSSIPWFTSVGKQPDRSDAVFVDFHFLAEHYEDPWSLWGDALVNAETAIERLEFADTRLGYHNAVQKAYKDSRFLPCPSVDLLYQRVNMDYSGPSGSYYRDTYMHPHELIDFPDRIVRGAALELMVADLDPTLSFFTSQMRWFHLGRWPVGWRGTWPDGLVVLW